MTETAVNSGTSEENGSLGFTRNDVLTWLKEDVEWLRQKGKQRASLKSSIKVSLLRASIYGCSVLLQGMKDTEIDTLTKEVEKIKEHLGMVKK